MLSAFRFFLICLLSLTLPLQGVSASLMALHEFDAPASVVAGEPMEACHTLGVVHPDATSFHEQGGHAGSYPAKLKACGSCCSAAMASVTVSPRLFPQGGELFVALRPVAPKGFIPDGLERPPRHLS